MVVQSLLHRVGVSPGPIDGRCGRRTIHAIEQFQRGVIRRPDGRIDVRGPTLRNLSERVAPSRIALPESANPPRVGRERRTRAAPVGSIPATPQPSKPIERPLQGSIAFWQERTALRGPSVNAGLTCPNSAQMLALLGDPNGHRVRSLIATETVGPFRATGLRSALASLRTIFADVRAKYPDLYQILRSNGMYVIRQTRNSSSYSNHAWGIAIDLLVGGKSPNYGDNFSSRGLDVLAPFFHKAGWYWGGGYRSVSRKDAMHFECGLALVRSFLA